MKSHVGLPAVEMEGHPIPESSSIKLLGININNMSWHDHVVGIAKLKTLLTGATTITLQGSHQTITRILLAYMGMCSEALLKASGVNPEKSNTFGCRT